MSERIECAVAWLRFRDIIALGMEWTEDELIFDGPIVEMKIKRRSLSTMTDDQFIALMRVLKELMEASKIFVAENLRMHREVAEAWEKKHT